MLLLIHQEKKRKKKRCQRHKKLFSEAVLSRSLFLLES